jgi:hypothetical protein
MEIQPVLLEEASEVDIHGCADTVEGRKPIFLDTFYIPQKVADVLKIKVDTLLFQPSSLASPVSEEMAMRTFEDLVAVRSAESFLFRCLCTRK